MNFKIREAQVAGKFYPSDPSQLQSQIENYLLGSNPFRSLPIGGVVPHAGIVFSGYTAGRFYGALPDLPDTIILLGPNHTGMGKPISVAPYKQWGIPTGFFESDIDFIDLFCENSYGIVEKDIDAHHFEHSLEVQLPFIKVLESKFNKTVKIVPIVLGYDDYHTSEVIAQFLYKTTSDFPNKNFMILASSDMSHFISQKDAENLDHIALKPYMNMETDKFYKIVRTKNISMCGVIPALITLFYSILQNSKYVDLLHYTTSAEVTEDFSSVVGYASLCIRK